MQAKQQMMMLPPSVAAEFSINVENALNNRAEAIMSGSAGAVDMSTSDFADISISAAKISAVYKDLVSKYENVRQSEEYAKNKTAYDTWFDMSNQTISVQASQGIDGAAQLDFFQPPILQPDIDVVTENVITFQRDYNPEDYRVITQVGATITTSFDESKAYENAVEMTKTYYNKGNSRTFTDLNYAASLALNPELRNDPEAIMAISSSMAEPGGMEDRLDELNVTKESDIDGLSVLASEKRELKNALRWVKERDRQLELHAQQLVESVRFRDTNRTSRAGGSSARGKFGSNFGTGDVVIGATSSALSSAGYSSTQKFGFASTKAGSRKQVGQGQNLMYYEGIFFDGSKHKALVYKPTASFLSQIQAGGLTDSQIASAILDPALFEQKIVDASLIKGDIPTEDWNIMTDLSEQEYLDNI
jgi:hypothetical protein